MSDESGADLALDVEGWFFVSLRGIATNKVLDGDGTERSMVGIEIARVKSDDGDLFGYWICLESEPPTADRPQYENGEAYDSLPDLCRDYGFPLDDVINRMAMSLLGWRDPHWT